MMDWKIWSENRRKLMEKKPQLTLLLEGIDPPDAPSSISIPPLPEKELALLPYLRAFVVFGALLPSDQDQLLHWLKKDEKSHLFLIESRLKEWSHFLAEKRTATFIDHPRIHLYLLQDHHPAAMAEMEELSWEILSLPYHISTRDEGNSFVRSHFLSILDSLEERIGEYRDYGATFYTHFYRNLNDIALSYNGEKLFDAFTSIPAIIVGAGPSLTKQLPQLQKVGSKALLFAGGSSLLALTRNNIEPHFAVGVDPNPPHFLRTVNQTAFRTPFFYRLRIHALALSAVTSPHIFLAGTGGYDIDGWLREILPLERETIDEGHNVVNLSLSLAKALGCNPIVLVGVDLAYSQEQLYPSGVIFETTKENPRPTKSAIATQDIYGKPIYTEHKWLHEAEWISSFKEELGECSLYNATEGGIGMRGVDNISFERFITDHLQEEWDLYGLIHSELQDAVWNLDVATIIEKERIKLKESATRSHQLLIALLDGMKERVTSSFMQGEGEIVGGELLFLELELEEEPFFRHVLALFQAFFLRKKSHAKERDRFLLSAFNHSQRREREVEEWIEMNVFLRRVCEAHLIMMERAINEHAEAHGWGID